MYVRRDVRYRYRYHYRTMYVIRVRRYISMDVFVEATYGRRGGCIAKYIAKFANYVRDGVT